MLSRWREWDKQSAARPDATGCVPRRAS
jgi:hypothetical protein